MLRGEEDKEMTNTENNSRSSTLYELPELKEEMNNENKDKNENEVENKDIIL